MLLKEKQRYWNKMHEYHIKWIHDWPIFEVILLMCTFIWLLIDWLFVLLFGEDADGKIK